jgi:hypothetical protein
MSKEREGEEELRTKAKSHPIAVRAIEVKPREYNLDIARWRQALAGRKSVSEQKQ